MTEQQRKLVLASTSPYRRELLSRLGLAFCTENPAVDERSLAHETPEQLVMRLSGLKAEAAAHHYPDALVIGSDQVAVCGTSVLGKPGSHDNAVRQLARLSGKRVTFMTGLCLLDSADQSRRVTLVPYSVDFRTLEMAQIERYLHREQPYNCAGSFKSEGLGISLFERMQGDDPSALIGLPLIQLVSWLNEAGLSVP